eukprot:TRINITY_DN24259_c0_g1_i1.p1 TRINITY_DN24259_c0_g1~~TRINITY_DN24259_c0_g1_i1.p1  ORF type:complete len:353 (+),score=42.17 TRINITY_DN24259_c0_g1_i1:105-1163(+)
MMMAQGMKRGPPPALAFQQPPAQKAPRINAGGYAAGGMNVSAGRDGPGWSCPQCGNLNFETRTTCNMRKCGAPRPGFEIRGGPSPGAPPPPMAAGGGGGRQDGPGWTCEKCGNHNFEGREVCNRRVCGAPGPWTCRSCNNKNYASRTHCNSRRCGLPRHAPGGGGGAPVGALAAQTQGISQMLQGVQTGMLDVNTATQALTQLVSALAAAPATASKAPAAGKAGNHPEGSWVCLNCANINFPTRTTCNAKNCGAERADVDGGPPKANANGCTIIQPDSWVCSDCGNINWSSRTTCNKRKCGRPRSEVDGGLASPAQVQAKAGQWTCPSCQNVNYPDRTFCNSRKCGKPRPMS